MTERCKVESCADGYAREVQACFDADRARWGWASRIWLSIPLIASARIRALEKKLASRAWRSDEDVMRALGFFGLQLDSDKPARLLSFDAAENQMETPAGQAFIRACSAIFCLEREPKLFEIEAPDPSLARFVDKDLLTKLLACDAGFMRLFRELAECAENPKFSFRFSVKEDISGALADSLNVGMQSGGLCEALKKKVALQEESELLAALGTVQTASRAVESL